MLSPKASGEFIAKRAKNVSIHEDGINSLAHELLQQLEKGNVRLGNICEHECYPQDVSDEAVIDWIFVLDTLNFCFWTAGKDKWIVSFKGKKYTGYFALCAAIARARNEGIDVINPKIYSQLTLDELRNIFRGETPKEVHLLQERLECLHQVGNILLDKYQGSFVNCLKASKNSAQSLLNLVVSEFSCFNDTSVYEDQQVSFHKRAQILVADIWTQFGGKGYGEFSDINTITMFADYRVPQPLVHFGAMSYSDKLMKVLSADTILEHGCDFEVEIRGCSIEVIERVNDSIKKLMEEKKKSYLCNSILIDNYLWLYRREHAEELEKIPFHKVISIYY